MVTDRSQRSWLGCGAILVLGLCWLTGQARAQGTAVGGIRGSAYDQDTATPLANVQVTIIELGRMAQTMDGRFVFEALPAGSYTLSFAKDGYARKILPEVAVTAGEFTEVRAELSPEITDMEEFVVKGFESSAGTELGLLDIRQESVSLSDAISADFIKKSGASTAANALRLVVGTTVKDGKYAVIRGLSDRYTTTGLNGIRLPTPDPDKRAVQMDQFPGAMIESITVTKTFTPDQQGDSTGGSVNIKTKAIPDGPVFSISSAAEYNTEATGNDHFLSYRGGGNNFLGIDDARNRHVPQDHFPSDGGPLPPFDVEQLKEAVTQSFGPVMGVRRTGAPPPNYSWGLTAGNRFDLGGDSKFGVLGTLSYRRKYSFYENAPFKTDALMAGDGITHENNLTDTRGVDDVLWSAVLGLGWRLNEEHEFSFTALRTQDAQDSARLLFNPNKFNQVSGSPVQGLADQYLSYTERSLDSFQLRGDHKLPEVHDTTVDWFVALSTAQQNDPDLRFLDEQLSHYPDQAAPGPIDLAQTNTHLMANNYRLWRTIQEESRQAKMDVATPVHLWTENPATIKWGLFADKVHRDFDQDTYKYVQNGMGGSGFNNYAAPGLIGDTFLNNPGWEIIPASEKLTTQTDFTSQGEQNIFAGYGMLELPVTSRLKIIGGVRPESTEMRTVVHSKVVLSGQGVMWGILPDGTYKDAYDTNFNANVQELDVLPAVSVNYQVITNLYLRGAWSQTIARPTFRELSPAATVNETKGGVDIGNPSLQISHIDNYDLRAEWFRRPGDVVAVSYFYKEIKDPIDVQFTFDGTQDGIQRNLFSPRNYPFARLQGVEFEVRQRLDVVNELLKDFTIGGNASLIQSRLKILPEQKTMFQRNGFNQDTRPMAGQPNYLLNANLVYDNQKSGTAVGLFYTVTGESLVAGETEQHSTEAAGLIPRVVEEPWDNLDISVEQRIGKNWRIVARAKNVTDPLIKQAYVNAISGHESLRTAYRRGVDLSLGASYTW